MSKSWAFPAAILAGFVLLAVAVFFGLQKSALKVGVVDLQRIKYESETGKKIIREIEEKQAEIQDEIIKAREKKDQEAETKLRQEFEEYVQNRSDEFQKQVDNLIRKTAKEKGLKAVFPKPVISYAEKLTDLTDELLKAL